MNGYNDIIAEPSDDEELAIACGFEIITEEELHSMLNMYHHNPPSSTSSSSSHHHPRGKGKIPPNKSTSSFASVASSSGVSSMMPKQMSSCSLSSQDSKMSDSDEDESDGMPDFDDGVYHRDEHQLSVENLWYMIQQKRHLNHDIEEEMRMLHHHFLTMEHASNSHNRLTEWFGNLIHFPEKLRQIAADKHRFNINKVPEQVREELKHIYVY